MFKLQSVMNVLMNHTRSRHRQQQRRRRAFEQWALPLRRRLRAPARRGAVSAQPTPARALWCRTCRCPIAAARVFPPHSPLVHCCSRICIRIAALLLLRVHHRATKRWPRVATAAATKHMHSMWMWTWFLDWETRAENTNSSVQRV